MKYREYPCDKFVNETFSRAPAPGGGGVSALAGALGAALGGMVCNLTIGKKKYKEYEEDVQNIADKLLVITDDLVKQIDEDAENFIPLSKAYGIKCETDEDKAKKQEVIQKALIVAMQPPVKIVKLCNQAIFLLDELVDKGSSLALSDVGCAAILLQGAIKSAYLNVIINVNMLEDENEADDILRELTFYKDKGIKESHNVYERVRRILNHEEEK